LNKGVGILHRRLSGGFLAWVNKVSGSVVFASGVTALLGLKK
jgi:hypothetical protein